MSVTADVDWEMATIAYGVRPMATLSNDVPACGTINVTPCSGRNVRDARVNAPGLSCKSVANIGVPPGYGLICATPAALAGNRRKPSRVEALASTNTQLFGVTVIEPAQVLTGPVYTIRKARLINRIEEADQGSAYGAPGTHEALKMLGVAIGTQEVPGTDPSVYDDKAPTATPLTIIASVDPAMAIEGSVGIVCITKLRLPEPEKEMLSIAKESVTTKFVFEPSGKAARPSPQIGRAHV